MAVITSGKTFANGEQLTADKLNQVITAATFATGAIDNGVMQIVSDAITVRDGGISFAKLTDVIDDDTMATASSTKLATSESIKEFVGVKQRTRVSNTTPLTLTNVITADDTTPLVGEGTQILSTSFTPTSTSNKIEVQFNGLLASNLAGAFTVIALFEDSTCVGAKWIRQADAGTAISSLQFQFTPSSTNAATYSLRVGPGAAGTSFVNQDNAAAFTLGGLMEYSMTVLEVKS